MPRKNALSHLTPAISPPTPVTSLPTFATDCEPETMSTPSFEARRTELASDATWIVAAVVVVEENVAGKKEKM